jgi:hypothetical protein
MKRSVLLVLLGLIMGVGAGSIASAATGWRVFATASDSGQYGAYASANADVLKPQALGVRTSKASDVSWFLSCQGEKKRAKAGEIVLTTVATSKKCSLSGSANTSDSGTLRVQLLRR